MFSGLGGGHDRSRLRRDGEV